MTKKAKSNLKKLMTGTLPPEPCKCKKIKGKHNLDDHCAAYSLDLPPCKLCEKYGNTPNAKTRAAMAEPRGKQIVVELDDLLNEIKTTPKSKMDRPMFELTWSHYDNKMSWLYYGPSGMTEDGFQKIVNKLIPKAIRQLISSKDSWIGADIIIDEVSLLLLKNGFDFIKPMAASYFGPVIIRHENDVKDMNLSSKALKSILKHNDKIERQLADCPKG